MKIPIYQVDAFASKQFSGNPAGVCLLNEWPEDALLQNIAAENNLAETAFLVPIDNDTFHLRWFTPTFEIPLCGHATLASAYVIFTFTDYSHRIVNFQTQSGKLSVENKEGLLWMNLPAYEMEPYPLCSQVIDSLGIAPMSFMKSGINLYAFYQNEQQVRQIQPNYPLLLDAIQSHEVIGVVASAMGTEYDFVSRYFAPEEGLTVTEDPVTGSIHAALVPYWGQKLNKKSMLAYQASQRGGVLQCRWQTEYEENRTLLGGEVQPYLLGEITV